MALSASSAAPRTQTPTRTVEIETKLEFDDGTSLPPLTGRPALTAVGVADSAEPEVLELDATYYDTAELNLLAGKLTLRRRTGGHDFGWHLKLPRAAGGRTEVAVPLTDDDTERVPAELDRLTRGMARGRELQPVARLQTRRTVHHLRDDTGRVLVEVADDEVTATDLTGRPGSGEPQRWREVEVELVDGTREQLAAVVDELLAAGAHPAASASKVGRALNPPASPLPPAEPTRAADAEGSTAGAVVRAAVTRAQAALLTADLGVREGTDGAAEQAAAALATARALIAVCHPVLGPVEGLADRAAAVAEQLVAVPAVHRTHRRLIGQVSDEPEDYARQGLAVLTRTLATRAEAAAADVAHLVDGPAYLEMLRGLDETVAGSAAQPRAGRAASGELPVLVGEAWKSLREDVDTLLADPGRPGEVRRVREGTVALRLAIEALTPALGEDATLLAASLEEVEEFLDEHHESARASALLLELAADPATDGVAGFLFGRLHAFEEALAHGALEDITGAWDRVEDGDLVAALAR